MITLLELLKKRGRETGLALLYRYHQVNVKKARNVYKFWEREINKVSINHKPIDEVYSLFIQSVFLLAGQLHFFVSKQKAIPKGLYWVLTEDKENVIFFNEGPIF